MGRFYNMFFNVFFTLVVHKIHACEYTEVRNYLFAKVAPSVDMFEYHDNDNITWSEVDSTLQCARLTLAQCCRPKGFLYDSSSRLCQPVFWQAKYPTEIPHLGTGASALFQFGGTVCRPGYEKLQYNSENITTCVALATEKVYFWTARRLCEEQNAFLASTKTLDKMADLVSRAQGQDIWIGLDDRKKNKVFVWIEDQTILSPEKTLELFQPGEPSHGTEQDCAAIKSGDSRLSDIKCASSKRLYFCEARPGC